MAIRPDTDSKSPAPRSGAPTGELEQYGVWVKAEPRDIVDEAPQPRAGDLDLELPGESSSIPEEAFLSEDEEKLLGSFDADFGDAEPLSEEARLPDIEDLPPIEEPILGSRAQRGDVAEEVEDLDAGTIDISLEELESTREPSPISPYAEIDVSSIEGLGAGTKAEPKTAAPATFHPMEDVSSEFLDTVEEAAPVETGENALGTDDVTAEFLEAGESPPPERPQEPAPDFEPIDIDLTFDDTIPSEQGPEGGEAEPGMAAFEEVTEFDDFLGEPAELSPAQQPQKPATASFDDVAAVERELSGKVERTADALPSASRADASSDVLLKIAEELSSIRGELVSLKAQLNELRPESAAPAEKETAAEAKAAGGFFDEEEDETIALTGDELDNILNTADFTEEVAEAAGPDEEEGAANLDDLLGQRGPQDISILDEAILPESGDYSAPAAKPSEIEPAIEELTLGESTAVERPQSEGELRAPEFEEISLMAEEGVRPMTEAPEDTSYLESALTSEGAELREAPPSEAPLVEPDLSDFDLEAEDLGASRPEEIEEELPVVEPSEAALEELTLGMEAGPGYAQEAPAEMEPIETLPEIDETSLEEISLHDEGHAADEGGLEELPELEELSAQDESERLSSDIDANTIKPAEPIGLHPDEIPMSLDDSYFVDKRPETAESGSAPVEAEEELVLDLEEEATAEKGIEVKEEATPLGGARIPAELPLAEELGEPAGPEPAPPAHGDDRLKAEIRSVLAYLDKLLDSLPEDKIEEFARSEHFDTYKRLFEELGLV